MCNYQGYEFGAGRYPDSVCIDGSLHDADNCDDAGNIYLKDEDIPCPICRPKEAIEWTAEYWCDTDNTVEECRITATKLINEIRKNRDVAPYAEATP